MAGKGELTVIEPGMLALARRNTRFTVNNADSGWFAPGQPTLPVSQQSKGRQFNYRVGINLNYTPKAGEGVNFWELRGIAENCDIIRLAIETRKDQIEKRRWNFKPKDPKAQPDQRCKDLTSFFAFPDKELSWKTWLRALVDDMLVIDAATIYPRKTLGNTPYSFELMDGATIKRVINLDGRTPAAPQVAYQQILYGVPAVDYSVDDLIYRRRNVRTYKLYGYSAVEQILTTANTAIRRALYQLKYFTSGTIPEGFLEAPATWQTEQIEEFQEYLDEMMAGDLDRRNQAFVVPNGMKFSPAKQPTLKDEFDEYLARIVCYAFSLPPTPFVKMMNRATSDTSKDSSLEEGLQPLMDWVKELIDYIVVKYFGYTDIEFDWEQDDDTDPLVQAQIDNIYVGGPGKAVKTVNEIRARLGLDPMPDGDILTPPPNTDTADNGGDDENDPPDGDKPDDEDDDESDTDKVAKRQGKKKASEKPPNNNHKTVIVAHGIAAASSVLTKFFSVEAPKMATAVCKGYVDLKNKIAKEDAPDDTSAGDNADRIVEDLSFSDWDSLPPKIADILKGVVAEGAEIALGKLKIDTQQMRLVVNKDAVALANKRAAEMVGKKWIGGELVDNPNAEWVITDATRDYLRTVIEQAIKEGWSTQKLRQTIIDNTAFSPDRADLIARTEMAAAHVDGNMISYRRSGVVHGKKWLLATNPCPVCEKNASVGIIPLDQEFPSGDDAAPAHPRCECDVAPITDKNRIGEKT